MEWEVVSLSAVGQGLIKGAVVIFLLLYSLFVLAVIRQVDLMSKVFHIPLEEKLRLASWLYMGVVLFLIVVVLVVL